MKVEFRLPRIDEHVAILGCTGSGKTTLATWILSKCPFDAVPYIAVDYKHDDLLASIDRIREIGTHERIPTSPGLYVVRPLPSDTDAVEDWLWRIWRRGNTGLYVDEAYLLPDKAAILNILSQGRSLRIPCLFASQRPVNVSRSVFTEASHLAVFRLNDRRDKKTIAEFSPPGMIDERLPDYCCNWYDVKADTYFPLSPVPQADVIVERINDRLADVYHVT